MDKLIIRQETKKDWFEVEEITRDAFWKDENIERLGTGCDEHYLVSKMREGAAVPELNLIAVLDDEVVGHIIYSDQGYVESSQGKRIKVLIFGPLTVKSAYQKQGIGGRLLAYSIEKAKELGYGAILIYGHPEYYPRFGFVEASTYKITTEDGKNFSAFMALELIEGYLNLGGGKFVLPTVYSPEVLSEGLLTYDLKFK